MRKILISLTVFVLNFINFFPLTSVDAVSLKEKDINHLMESRYKSIKAGKKIPLSETMSKDKKEIISGELIIGIDESKKSEVMNFLANQKSENVKSLFFTDNKEIGTYLVKTNKNVDTFADELYRIEGVLYVENNIKMYALAVPSFDDPLLTVNNDYSDLSKQWYLNQPENDNYGIDLKRAQEYLDLNGFDWGGEFRNNCCSSRYRSSI